MNPTMSRTRRWLTETALPMWARVGVDHDAGGFVERLRLDGAPDFSAAKRVRVQARQLYVFSHAAVLGLMPDGADIARTGYDFLIDHACPDGPDAGVVHALDRDGTLRDPRRDTYDHAFVIFALSWFYQATGRDDVRSMIDRIANATWTILRSPDGSGFAVDDHMGDARHQNPHMHLFEAMLAAYDATESGIFLDRATELFELFRGQMFDARVGVLREFHDRNWSPASEDAGQIVEPGHHCEWVWLLEWYARRTGTPLCEEAIRLYDFAERYGRPDGRLLCDQLWPDGQVKLASTRSWPQTEAIKADVAIARSVGRAIGSRTDAIVDVLFDSFLEKPVVGGWIDWIDPAGHPLVSAIPASSFYHIFLGFSEYLGAGPDRT